MCKKKELTIIDMKDFVKEKGGKYLSKEYNYLEKSLWECKNGHQWKAFYSDVFYNWCPECKNIENNNGNIKKTNKYVHHSIEEIKQIATERGGECLSNVYDNIFAKLKFKCGNGHIFETSAKCILDKHWCSYCKNSGLGEEIVRSFLETIYNKKFNKFKAEWLINDDGNRMEVDGANEELKLCFEHNGRQHDEEVKYFKIDDKRLEKIIKDDETKIRLMKEYGYKMIIIPELFHKTSLEKLRETIKEKLLEQNIEIPNDYDNIYYNINKAYKSTTSIRIENELKEIIENKGGQLLSRYISSNIRLQVKCENNHIWEILPGNVRKYWCPFCVGFKKTSEQKLEIINKAKEIAIINGGKCLSEDYDKTNELLFECGCGYQFKAKYRRIIKEGQWCPKCAGRRNTIEDAIELAEKRNGKCLSEEYISAQTHMLWECNCGHKWKAQFVNIKQGTWCPFCALIKVPGSKNIIDLKKHQKYNKE